MRIISTIRLTLILGLIFVFEDCTDKCSVTSTYTYFVPVYSTTAEVKSAVQFQPAREIKHPGRIYLKDQYLYINEPGEGIHIIDNKNPAVPQSLGFLKIPGNSELSIAGDMLYADSFVDLVVFDVSDKSSIHEAYRVERVFNHTSWYGFATSTNNLVLTDWKEMKQISVNESTCEMNRNPWGGIYFEDGIALSFSSLSSSGVSPTSSGSSTGQGGSLARFTVAQNTLYALDGEYLDIVDITQPESPKVIKEINTGWDVETLFPYKDKLFAGSRTGMYIYDLKNPIAPALISKYIHLLSCDPVVVDDSYAYVTLRNGNTCWGGVNQLEVIDITNLTAPKSVKMYPMKNPHGLGIDRTTLFICDGFAGLKIYNAANVKTIDANLLAQYSDIQAVDIVPYQNIAMVIASDGLYQYDYSDVANIHLISKLPIAQ